MKSWIWKSAWLWVLLAVALWWFFPGLYPEVAVAPVVRGEAVDAVAGNVRVLAAREAVVKATEGGVVEQALLPAAGESLEVSKGEIICQLDTRFIDFEIEHARIESAAAERRLAIGSPLEIEHEMEQTELARLERLVAMEHTPESEHTRKTSNVERIRRQMELQRAEWESAVARRETRLDELKARRERMAIRSPVDGYLVENHAFVGDLLHPGSPVAKIFSRTQTLEVSVSEEDFGGLEPGMYASIRLLGMAGRVFTGKISALAPTSDPATKRRLVYVSIDNAASGEFATGMTGEASLTRHARAQALLIPRRALLGDAVFVIDDGVARLRTVVPGYTGLLQAEILSGLSAGEQVATDNLSRLRDGDRVRVRP